MSTELVGLVLSTLACGVFIGVFVSALLGRWDR